MARVLFFIQQLTLMEINNMINKTRLRAYAKTMQNGTRTIEEVPEEYRVPVYVELTASSNWTIEMVGENYKAEVKRELGIVEA